MKKILLLVSIFFVLSLSSVYAECVVPTNGMIITEDTTLCPGTYYFCPEELPCIDYDYPPWFICSYSSINFGEDNIVLDCNGAEIHGCHKYLGSNSWPYLPIYDNGIEITDKSGVTIKNCVIKDYFMGVLVNHSDNNIVRDNTLTDNFKGIFFRNSSYNKAINNFINYVSTVEFPHQGIRLGYSGYIVDKNITSTNNQILNNTINFNNKGYGIFLIATYDNVILGNNISNTHFGVYSLDMWMSNKNVISYNNIYNNKYQNFWSESYTEKDLINNWWGTTNCSLIDEKICDKGDYDVFGGECRGEVIFEPFLNAPYPFGKSVSCNDLDGDGVPNSEDKCPNTIGEQLVYGCSCEQILKLKPGEDTATNREGCSKGIVEVFTKGIGWAKDLFG